VGGEGGERDRSIIYILHIEDPSSLPFRAILSFTFILMFYIFQPIENNATIISEKESE
jgi:hypothetical protein